MLKLVSFHIQAHLNAFLQILEYFSQSVDVDGLNLLAYGVFGLFDCAGCILVHFALQQAPKKEVGRREIGFPFSLTFKPISGCNTSMVHVFHQIPFKMPSEMP